MPKVYNLKIDDFPVDAVYVGRWSGFGNPYTIGINGSRDEVCDMFEAMVKRDKTFQKKIISKLRGKDLVCHCKPKRCHADFLLKVANGEKI